MKKMYMQRFKIVRLLLPSAIGCLCALAPHAADAQTYYSTFFNPEGRYIITEPSGGACNAPAVQNAASFADANINNFTSFSGTISSPLTCSNGNYVFNTALKLLPDSSYITGGLSAGFKLRIPTRISKARLTQNISLQTFLGSTLQESFNGNQLFAVDLGVDTVNFIVYANTTLNFNRVQLTVNTNIFPLNTDFEFDIIYALASNAQTLPVSISNYRATAAGNNVTLSWQAENEVNLSGYRIERSKNSGASYSPVAIIPAKGSNGITTTYNYTDQAVGNGNYLYRIVAIDKNGAFKTTNAILVSINGKVFLQLLPSIVKAGQRVVVNTSFASGYKVAVFDLQGRMVQQQQVNSNDKVSINTGGLSAGTYVVKIITASGSISQAKFVVN